MSNEGRDIRVSCVVVAILEELNNNESSGVWARVRALYMSLPDSSERTRIWVSVDERLDSRHLKKSMRNHVASWEYAVSKAGSKGGDS